MMGPEGVTEAMVAHIRRGMPLALAQIRAQRNLTELQLPPLAQITGYAPQQLTLAMLPCLALDVEDTTGRIDTRRVVDGAEYDQYQRVYRVNARVWVAGANEPDTKRAMHRYALAAREGFQIYRRVDQLVPKNDSLEIMTRQTRETYHGSAEQSGRFIASASFLVYARAEELVPIPQRLGSGKPPTAGSIEVGVGGGSAGKDPQGNLVPGGVKSVAPLIERL